MSVPPVYRPRPTLGTHPARPASSISGGRVRWGWIEWFIIGQTALMAMLFVPGVSKLRTLLRVGVFVLGFVGWGVIAFRGRREPPGSVFLARPWLVFCAGWLVLSIAHPNSYTIPAAVAQVALYLAVMAPAFWAGPALDSHRQVTRVMAVLFLVNALSAALGVAQVFRPSTFNPPVIPAMNNKFHGENLMYEGAGGVKILRPCGLTDTPGGASSAGSAAALLGLCFALRPMAIGKRLASAVLAFLGVAVIYYSHVRSQLVMLIICIAGLTLLFILRRDYKKAMTLAVAGAGAVVGAMLWAMRTAGTGVLERFMLLVKDDPLAYYNRMRGNYVSEALEQVLWENPLGYGLGWWGQINGLFADPRRISPVWVEVMVPAWVFDGGLPLLVGYVGAIVAALLDTARVALTSRDRDLAFWATVILALNFSLATTCMSYTTFLSQLGPNFWLLSAMIHAADLKARTSSKAMTAPARSRRGARV